MLYDKTYNLLMENFRSIKTVSRLFYPRNFSLSEEFIKAFNKEYSRLKSMKIDDKRILQKMTRALPFHKDSN
jgi:hypothetical protein